MVTVPLFVLITLSAIAQCLKSLYCPQQWYAIALSNVGDYEGTKAKLANAFVMKEHFEVRFQLSMALGYQ